MPLVSLGFGGGGGGGGYVEFRYTNSTSTTKTFIMNVGNGGPGDISLVGSFLNPPKTYSSGYGTSGVAKVYWNRPL